MRVIDGDTIEIAGGAHVRYIGMDTPETYPKVEFYGLEAKAKNIELVETIADLVDELAVSRQPSAGDSSSYL